MAIIDLQRVYAFGLWIFYQPGACKTGSNAFIHFLIYYPTFYTHSVHKYVNKYCLFLFLLSVEAKV